MKQIGTLFLLFVLSACDNSNDNNESEIIGSWVTISCAQLTDSNNLPINAWAKSTYTFDTNSNIFFETKTYTDSDCVTATNFNVIQPALVAIFVDLGAVTTSQGIEANSISIYFSSSPSPITTRGYYKVTNNQLCLSQSFHFDAASFGIGQVDDTDIDFTNCLTKKQP